MHRVISKNLIALFVIGWVWLLPVKAQPLELNAKPLPRSTQDIVVLQSEDIADEFDRQNLSVESAARRQQFRNFKLSRYATRKAEFIAFAAARGIVAIDVFPELPMLSVPQGVSLDSSSGVPWLAYVAPNWEMHLHLAESGELINKHLLRRTFPDADARDVLGGKGTTVMILDTGVDFLVKELGGCVGPRCKVVVSKDFTPQDDNQRDPNRHGTNVAAIAAGTWGIAPDARIVSGDVMDTAGKISTSYVLNAIGWAIANRDTYNIVAINMSFGGGPYHSGNCTRSAYGAAVSDARRSGIVVVASAGNDFNPEGMAEPACVPFVVSVGAVFDGGKVDPAVCEGSHPVDEVTCFSNSSQVTRMLAPGAQISAGGESKSGTSQAAPHVTGAVSVLRSMEPSLSVTQIENRLRATGIPVQDKRNGRIIPRLDLIALLQDSLQRPLPLPPEKEWWRTGDVEGKQLPVLTDPWFEWLLAPSAGIYDRATSILWRQPDPAKISVPVALRTAENYCRRLGSRLPTRHEMDSIQDVRRLRPTIDPSIFKDVVSGPYWTITPSRREGSSNWVVDLSDGRAYEVIAANSSANFFCVSDLRGDPPVVQYIDQGVTVKDNATGHVWQKGTVVAQGHQELANACADSNVGGKRWRVPTWKELSTLLSAAHEAPYLDPMFSGELALVSSTPAAKRGLDFRFINFQTGISGSTASASTRCIEQEASEPAAPGRVFHGSVWIGGRDVAASRALQQFEAGMYAVIEGDLNISGINSASIILPYIRKITGRLVLSGTDAAWISLPALEAVGSSLEITDNAKLESLWMPSLISVDGSLVIQSNRQLGALQPDGDTEQVVSLDMPALDRIGGDFNLKLNPQLKSVTLYGLRTVGRGLNITSNTAMWQLRLNGLQSVGLACRSHSDFCGDLSVESNSQLVIATLPSLASIEYNLRITGNPLLETVQQRLNKVFELHVDFNRKFCERRQIDPILTHLWRNNSFPQKIYIYNNSNDAECRSRCPNESPSACEIYRDPWASGATNTGNAILRPRELHPPKQ